MTNQVPMNSSRCLTRPRTITLALLVLTLTFLLLSTQEKTTVQAQKSSQMNESKSGVNAPAPPPPPPIGNVQQLSKALGNNSQILKGNVNIGNPNASKAASAQQKIASGTQTSGLASSPTKAEPKNFVADLSGKSMIPPIDTNAKGSAKIHINPNGTLSYEINASNINGVIGAHIGLNNGTELADLINPYASVNHQSVYPTGQVSGTLSSGILTGDKLLGPLIGKGISDLVNLMKSKSVYVTIRTTQHQHGEIQGQLTPSA